LPNHHVWSHNEEGISSIIVDDDYIDKQIFAEALTVIGTAYTLRSSKNIQELFLMLSEPPLPHLIFLDINLPGTNGIDGLRSLKANTIFSHVPVVIYL
jgi:CheY-like chemotaxis protein